LDINRIDLILTIVNSQKNEGKLNF